MTFYAQTQDSSYQGPYRHLFCPRHISLGPVCGTDNITTGLSESTPLCPECEDTDLVCPRCGFPDERHASPLGNPILRTPW